MMLNPFANVSISVSGLAICHYNSTNKTWEFLLPREIPDHTLKIIFTKYYKDGRVTTREIPIAKSVTQISVETKDKFEPSSEKEFNFIGGADKDDRDARWILDIAELYGKPVELQNINQKIYTYLSIPAGTLYNKKFPDNPFVIVNNPNSTSKNMKVAQSAGIDIQWEMGKGSTTIKNSVDATDLINEILRDESVSSYEVEFNNDCPKKCVGKETDYKYYNEDLIVLDDKFTVYSVASFSADNEAIASIGEVFLKLLSGSISSLLCADAPCFLGECSSLDGISSLKELLK
jgi:hypothetical protein